MSWLLIISAMRQKIKNTLILLSLLVLQTLTRILPWAIALKIGRFLGASFHDWVPKERTRALQNLALAFPQSSATERAALTRRIFIQIGQNGMEFIKMYSTSAIRIAGLVDGVTGRENMERALSQGRGIICLTAHLGNWEILPVFTSQQGWPTAVVAQRLYDSRLDQLLNHFREARGILVIKRGEVTRDIIRCLRKNMLLGVLNDQDTEVDSRWAPFFGRPAKTPIGIFRLTRRTGAVVVPVFIARTPEGKNRVYIEPEIRLPQTEDEEQDLLFAARQTNAVIEQFVRRFPEQWVWFHQRWKNSPPPPASDAQTI